jgi:hypothetical protein
LTIIRLETVDERAPALQTQVAAAEYEVILLDLAAGYDLETKITELMSKSSLPRERRGKPYDLRPLIQSLIYLLAKPSQSEVGKEGGGMLRMVLSAREGATGRPEEVLAELGIQMEGLRIERTRLIFKSGIE